MRFKAENLPAGLKLKWRHHRTGGRSQWVTTAVIVEESTGLPVSAGAAVCARQDQPSRRIGREIACGRALKNYFQGPT